MSKPTRSFEILELLTRYDVDFMVVGMTAAVLQGAPAVTFDLDILYSRRADNVERLLSALTELDAVFRADPRNLRPQRSHLESAGHKLLMTRWGVLDALGSLGEQNFEDLEDDVVTLEVEDLTCRILSLERLIEVKKRAGRPKDLAVLPLLEATLARSRGRE
ncbi:MAG: hypothetical protein GTO30_03420 [Acidobacteria bacterium]|nr:hypothetical protein [Acidobacteriota bacterium]NIM60717.1 hypothetical protein [Acidobacteriota bacterium]NIO59537.1 hypothetical protein [Acidobacteriota bacterium]NIQ85523.1 hypothetical protein [Acidobacteriota bacterium]NIT11244.1 hypothetical protein [Acidobacteriota bacterium]